MSDFAKKFQIKPEMAGGIVALPADVALPFPQLKKLGPKKLDYLIVFVASAADVSKRAPAALRAIREDGVLWFCHPKKSSGIKTDISRDEGWETLQAAGYRGVRSIAIDATWSAVRFRELRFVQPSK